MEPLDFQLGHGFDAAEEVLMVGYIFFRIAGTTDYAAGCVDMKGDNTVVGARPLVSGYDANDHLVMWCAVGVAVYITDDNLLAASGFDSGCHDDLHGAIPVK